MSALLYLVVVGVATLLPSPTVGHGYLIDPAQRSSVWRVQKFIPMHPPQNYDDNGLNCGGISYQKVHGYKCGVCGDPWKGPLENEAGGKYAKNIITGRYQQGADVTFTATITANHLGWFEFRVCPVGIGEKVTQACLDRYPLSLAGRPGNIQHHIGSRKGNIETTVSLPVGLSCTHCVLQWKYHASNSPGQAHQEEFINCADIEIMPLGGPAPPAQTPFPVPYQTPTPMPTVVPPLTTQAPPTSQCRGNLGQARDKKCADECSSSGCPGEVAGLKCTCSSGSCRAWSDMDTWCSSNCALDNCPAQFCTCNLDGRTCPGRNSVYDVWCLNQCEKTSCNPGLCVCPH
ncbi:uncharacterized protein LOC101845159 [Aplysia californica]|uniref:Uncharacterized protein LOC101845159 n=1 Tax=Aplysia californica TaxID=6500 RepID=A0ABM0JKS3_APLCA|nr:uncharacterized protein LOC101845159 [Aplysia californica]